MSETRKVVIGEYYYLKGYHDHIIKILEKLDDEGPEKFSGACLIFFTGKVLNPYRISSCDLDLTRQVTEAELSEAKARAVGVVTASINEF